MHADGGARRVPALGQQHRVDQHVDLAALVGGERLRQPYRRRPAGDGLGLQPGGAELLREVVGVVDAGRVDDPGRRVEALAVEARGRLVQGLVVEGRGQRALLEVAADDRDRVDRGRGRHAEAAERRDQAAAGRVGERQVVDRGGEDVRDLLRDQLLGRRHADVDRLREAADRRARLLAERRVRLVADHELVGLARERVGVPREPGVRLDRDRVAAERLLAALDRVGEAVAVALGGQVALELRDEQAAVGEDEDPERARGLDEAGRGDRLARTRSGGGSGSGGRRPGPRPAKSSTSSSSSSTSGRSSSSASSASSSADVAVAVPVLLLLGLALVRGDQLGQHPGERVDLVLAQLGAGGGGGRLSRRGRAPGRAGGRSGPSSAARASCGRPRSRRALRRAPRGGRCRARALRPDPRRRRGAARRPSPARGTRWPPAQRPRPT